MRAALALVLSALVAIIAAPVAVTQTTSSTESLPLPTPREVLVNGRKAPHPSLYKRLFADLPAAEAPPDGTPTASIDVRFGGNGPGHEVRFRYAPTENTVERSDGWATVPDEVAARIEADLRREGIRGRRGWGSSIVLALVVTGALFVFWLTFYRRKWWKTGGRKRPVREPEGEAPRSSPRR
jgi:hypothetical protein